MNIEARLADRVGPLAGKLHTARSRNDQVATDLRLYLKDAVPATTKRIRVVQSALVDMAERNRDVAIPGYTHVQRAQPVLLAHHLLAYFEMLERDVSRLGDCLARADVLPLGSGALAGLTYNLDREFVAGELGFSRVSRNSMDAVSDRDFVVELQADCAILMMHLSRLAEELVLWSSAEFGFIEIDDAYATGSSIMPQKKNPDMAELARGKTGRVYGHLMAILTVLKGLPLTYNRDLQEDKEALFDTLDTVGSTLRVFAGMVRTLKVNRERCEEAAGAGYILATDIADYLVSKGLPFREAHGVVGRLVKHAAAEGKPLSALGLDDYRCFSPLFSEDVLSIGVPSSLAARDTIGGTAPRRVDAALQQARQILEGAK